MANRAEPRLDSLIGREDDIEGVLDLLTTNRLVTLTGPGGSGKTRLAEAVLRTARNLGREAWLVDCSAILDPDLMPQAIAAALELGPGTGIPVEQLIVARLTGHASLLVLDNLEQIDGAGAPAARLLDAVAELTILATSRRPLGAGGEHEYPVGPLDLPAGPTPAAIEASSAGTLFLARSRARANGFAVDDGNAADIAELLRRLDGLPLALELAAARMRTMSPRELNRRLEQLGPGAVDGPETDVRRSLRSIVDWTVGQLAPDELVALEATTVCAGFDLELLGALVPGNDVVPALESLVALGLVKREEPIRGQSRYRVLVTIQSGIGARLTADRRAELQARHADHFAGRVADWARRAEGGEGREVVVEQDLDADNIRRAFGFVEQADMHRAAALLLELNPFFNAHGRWLEGYEAFVRLRERTAHPTPALVRAALVVADLIWLGTTLATVVDLLDWAVREARTLDDQPLYEEALYYRAITAVAEADTDAVESLRTAWGALPPATDAGARGRRLNFEISLGEADGTLRGGAGEALYRAAIDELGGIHDDRSLWRVVDLGMSLLDAGKLEEAEHYARLALTRYLDIGAELYANWAARLLAIVLVTQGRADEAREVLLIGTAIALRSGSTDAYAANLFAAVAVAEALARPLPAARYYGAVMRGMESTGEKLQAHRQEMIDGWLARASRAETPVAIELAVREGREADLRTVVASIPDDLRGSRAPGTEQRRGPALRHGTLTPREIEILSLVGAGRSDGDIASELFISPKTASVHVSNVKAKLGVDSRLELALRARDLGLVRT